MRIQGEGNRFTELMNCYRFAELHIFQTQMARVHRPRQHGQHRLQPEGLQHVIKRAHLHRIDGRLDRALAGHHDADYIRIDLHCFANEFDAVDSRHHQVRQEHVKFLTPQGCQGVFAGRKTGGFIALPGQRLDENILQLDLVVDDQDFSDAAVHHCKFPNDPLVVAGNTMRTVVPPPA